MAEGLHEELAVVSVISPQTVNNASATSTWVDASKFNELLFVISIGATDATVNAKLQEANDGSGGGATDIPGKAITQLSDTDDNKQAVIHVRSDELSKRYVGCVVTVGAGVTGAVISVVGLGGECRYGPASDYDLATVAQIVE